MIEREGRAIEIECVGSAESDDVEMLTKSINISLLMADELTDDLFTAATLRSPLELHSRFNLTHYIMLMY